MNFTTATSASPASVIELPVRTGQPTIMQDHEFGSNDEIIRWCGSNELFFAIEVDGIMELSTGPHA